MNVLRALALPVLVANTLVASSGEAATRGGTLTYGRGSDAVGLDPAHESDGESFKVCDNLYEGLVRFADGATSLEPGLALSWETSADGKAWTFHLRDGVRFHCGRAFDAAAVEYSLARQWSAAEPKHPDFGIGGPNPFWGYLGMDEVLSGIDVVDPRTIRMRLAQPNAPFLANLACNFAAIVCPEHAHARGQDFFRNPCGTGPFRFVEWRSSESITLERFEEYWGKAAWLDRVVFRSIPENSTRFFELLSGSVHIMDGVPPDEVPAIDANRNLTLVREPGINVAYLAMNLDHAPFKDVHVRRAVNHAIDTHAIVKGLYAGLAQEAAGPLPPSVFGAHPDLPDYDYDPDLARELLTKAGYPEGFETTLWTMTGPRPYMPQPLRLAQAIQADLAGVGIRAKIVSYEWSEYLDRVHRGHHDLALLGWQADSGDPDNFLFVHFDKSATVPPAGNIAFYRDERVHELLLAGQETVLPKARLPLYLEAQEIIHRDAPWVPLAHMMELAAMRKNVQGFRLHPTGRLGLAPVWLGE